MKYIKQILISLLISLSVTTNSIAATVRVDFQGSVNLSDDIQSGSVLSPELSALFTESSIITGGFLYEEGHPFVFSDSCTDTSLCVSNYQGAASNLQSEISGFEFTDSDNNVSFADRPVSDLPSTGTFFWDIATTTTPVSGTGLFSFSIFWTLNSDTPLTTGRIPDESEISNAGWMIEFNDFGYTNIHGTSGSYLRGSLTSYSVTAVPVPVSLWLFASGLAGLLSFAKSRKN